MPDQKITDLDDAGALDGSEYIPIVQGGNKKVTTAQLKAYAVSVPTYNARTYTNPTDGDPIFVTGDDIVSDIYIHITDSVERVSGFPITLAQSADYQEGQTIRIRILTNADISGTLTIQDALEHALTKGELNNAIPSSSDMTWLYQLRAGHIELLAYTE